MKRLLFFWLLVLLALDTQAGSLVQFRTTAGDLDVELFDVDKPVTVQNFLSYVRSGAYVNMFLHRCLPGFIVQGGGFSVANPADTNSFVPAGTYFVPTFAPITNEFNVGRRLTNSFGTIAMAKLDGDPNSATSQWFFNLTNNGPNLDFQNGGFTVFGHVVSGLSVLTNFNSRNVNTANGIVNLLWTGMTNGFNSTFSDLPVNYSGFLYPHYSNLIYVYDISLLNVAVHPGTNRVREISWKSVASRTNFVEFTTNLPPAWVTLAVTNGNGSTIKVVDTVTNALRRFYRVRVNY